jgi:TonB family protein
MPEPGQNAEGSKGAPAPGAVKPASTPGATAAEAASGQEPVAQAEARPNAAPRKPFNAESLSQRLRPVRATDMPDAPEVGRGSETVSAGVPAGMGTMQQPVLASAPAASAPQTAPAQAASTARASAGDGRVQQAQLISRTAPQYPQLAKLSGATGEVVLSAIIGSDGKVKDVSVVSGSPLLRDAAIAAVKQWVYKPALLNGKPTESDTRIQLNFVKQR